MEYSVVIPAAGSGSRLNLGFNKLLYEIEPNLTIIEKTVNIFKNDQNCKQIILVSSETDQKILKELFKESVEYVLGGETRQESVYNGLKKVDQKYVLIHDGARPYLTSEVLEDVKKTVVKYQACLVMVKAIDTMKIVKDGFVNSSLERQYVYHAQTPQAFELDLIKKAYQLAFADNYLGTDDASLVEKYLDLQIKVVEGDYANIKITTRKDLNI